MAYDKFTGYDFYDKAKLDDFNLTQSVLLQDGRNKAAERLQKDKKPKINYDLPDVKSSDLLNANAVVQKEAFDLKSQIVDAIYNDLPTNQQLDKYKYLIYAAGRYKDVEAQIKDDYEKRKGEKRLDAYKHFSNQVERFRLKGDEEIYGRQIGEYQSMQDVINNNPETILNREEAVKHFIDLLENNKVTIEQAPSIGAQSTYEVSGKYLNKAIIDKIKKNEPIKLSEIKIDDGFINAYMEANKDVNLRTAYNNMAIQEIMADNNIKSVEEFNDRLKSDEPILSKSGLSLAELAKKKAEEDIKAQLGVIQKIHTGYKYDEHKLQAQTLQQKDINTLIKSHNYTDDKTVETSPYYRSLKEVYSGELSDYIKKSGVFQENLAQTQIKYKYKEAPVGKSSVISISTGYDLLTGKKTQPLTEFQIDAANNINTRLKIGNVVIRYDNEEEVRNIISKMSRKEAEQWLKDNIDSNGRIKEKALDRRILVLGEDKTQKLSDAPEESYETLNSELSKLAAEIKAIEESHKGGMPMTKGEKEKLRDYLSRYTEIKNIISKNTKMTIEVPFEEHKYNLFNRDEEKVIRKQSLLAASELYKPIVKMIEAKAQSNNNKGNKRISLNPSNTVNFKISK